MEMSKELLLINIVFLDCNLFFLSRIWFVIYKFIVALGYFKFSTEKLLSLHIDSLLNIYLIFYVSDIG
jgi:hypothetical protein